MILGEKMNEYSVLQHLKNFTSKAKSRRVNGH